MKINNLRDIGHITLHYQKNQMTDILKGKASVHAASVAQDWLTMYGELTERNARRKKAFIDKAEAEARRIVEDFMEYQSIDKFPGPEQLYWSERIQTWLSSKIASTIIARCSDEGET